MTSASNVVIIDPLGCCQRPPRLRPKRGIRPANGRMPASKGTPRKLLHSQNMPVHSGRFAFWSTMDATQMMPMDEAHEASVVKFCIAKSTDGSLTYYTERNGQAEQEMPANDIGQALKMALDAFREADGGAEKGGFDSVNDPLARGPMPPRKPKYGGPEQ